MSTNPSPQTVIGKAFSVRCHPVSGLPEALVINNKYPKGGLTPNGIVVPVLHLLHKLSFLGRNDTEAPFDMIFGQYERMRRLQDDCEALNEATDLQIQTDLALANRLKVFLDTLSGLGYSMPKTGRVAVVFENLDELVQLIEDNFSSVIKDGEASRGSSLIPVAYMALQDIYRIGDIVSTRSVGGLSGTLIGLKISDCYYESTKSLFGGLKYSFRMSLESIVPLAGEYVSVKFMYIFEEWKGTKDQSTLPFQRVSAEEEIELSSRVLKLRELNLKSHSYQRYYPGCFFPHFKGVQNMGASTSSSQKAAGGNLITDSLRGTDLGHSPASMVDELGMAIALATKLIRQVNRSLSDSDSSKLKSDRLDAAGLTVWDEIPVGLECICWPSVVAFSLSMKVWGHVLIDGLTPVHQNLKPWQQLVLPPKTKEMLLAMTASTQRHGPNESVRYQYIDVVDTKGGGVLFLLYGPPGGLYLI
jgi:hypothetical protein